MTEDEIIDCAQKLPNPTNIVPNGYHLGLYPTTNSCIKYTYIHGQQAESFNIPSMYLSNIHTVLRQRFAPAPHCIIHHIVSSLYPIDIPVYNYSDEPTILTWTTRERQHNDCRRFDLSAIPDLRINLSDTIAQNMHALQQHLDHHIARICHHTDLAYKNNTIEYATKDPNMPHITFYLSVKGVQYSSDMEIYICVSHNKNYHQYKKFVLPINHITNFDALYQKHTTRLLHDIEKHIQYYSNGPQSQHQHIAILRGIHTQLTDPNKLYRYAHQCLHAMHEHYIYLPHTCLVTPGEKPSPI